MKNIKFLFMPLSILLAAGAASAAPLTKEAANKLMMKSGCATCHSVDKSKIGPAYKEVGARYRNPSPETLAYLKGEKPVDYLVKKVRSGTKIGVNKNWLKSPEGKPYGMMTPNPVSKISDADLKELIAFIIEIK